MPTYPERMATVEANQKNYDDTQKEIFSYMKEGRLKRDEMIKGFTELCERVEAVGKYQEVCEQDRAKLAVRVTSLEDTRTKQGGVFVGVSVVIGAIGGIAGALVEYFRRG